MPKCKRCGANIEFIRMKTGKYMPVDPDKVPYRLGFGTQAFVTPEGEMVRGGDPFGPERADGFGYVPHWATCPFADDFRR